MKLQKDPKGLTLRARKHDRFFCSGCKQQQIAPVNQEKEKIHWHVQNHEQVQKLHGFIQRDFSSDISNLHRRTLVQLHSKSIIHGLSFGK